MSGVVQKVSGPLIVAKGMQDANVADLVYVSDMGLTGEILNMVDDVAAIQVYEETGGIAPGASVTGSGYPISVELGPGLLEGMFDGIQRPLDALFRQSGHTIRRGININALSHRKHWIFTPSVALGDEVEAGDVLGVVQETAAIVHKIMVPHGLKGRVAAVQEGSFVVTDSIATIEKENGEKVEVPMAQRWPVRVPRPYKRKLVPTQPLCSGQRVIDTFFPIAKGGTGAVPGPFGSGKTIVQHQLAKWSDVDIVVYIGCGERGNEMTDVLREFPELIDPHTGQALMKRTVLIANTSDMPVAAREISIYTGITIAEYYRDMGYHVAVIADSTSRWAEALREMSARLEEMPGEEGYPAYLSSRLAQFYERAGVVKCLGHEDREGSVTAIGAVSPPGGDLSEPVSQATMRIVKVFWALDSSLAYARHFPAIHWLKSHSLYVESLKKWFDENLGENFIANRARALQILQEEATLQEVVRLVGQDSLSAQDRLTLETAKMIREDFLQQNAFVEVDCYSVYKRQALLLELILAFDEKIRRSLTPKCDVKSFLSIPVRDKIGRAKSVSENEYGATYAALKNQINDEVDRVCLEGKNA